MERSGIRDDRSTAHPESTVLLSGYGPAQDFESSVRGYYLDLIED